MESNLRKKTKQLSIDFGTFRISLYTANTAQASIQCKWHYTAVKYIKVILIASGSQGQKIQENR